MDKILVTGCAGFIGSHVCEALLKKDYDVIGIDKVNDYYDVRLKEDNLRLLEKYSNFTFFKIDICDYKSLKEIFDSFNIDYVAHLAARAGVRPSIKNPFIYEQSNIKGTLNLLELSKENVKNFVLTSSSSVYGNCKKTPFKEDFDVSYPISPYAATKKSCEELAYTYHHLYGLYVNIIRPFTVYGPRGRLDMAPFIFLKNVYSGVSIKKYGDGNSKRDYTYIDDFVKGFIKAIFRPFGYEIFNLGNSDTISLNQFISYVENITGKKAIIKNFEMQPGDVDLTYADISKAKKMLDYEPKTKFYDGLKLTFDWMKKNIL